MRALSDTSPDFPFYLAREHDGRTVVLRWLHSGSNVPLTFSSPENARDFIAGYKYALAVQADDTARSEADKHLHPLQSA